MRCLICNKAAKEQEDKKLNIKTYQCMNCQYIFKDPSATWTLDMQKERYDLHQNDPNDDGYRRYFQGFLDFVLPRISDVESALDFGCGESSLLADMLMENGIKSRYYDPIYHPDESSLESTYDLIVCVEVFEHLGEPMETIKIMIDMLKQGGYMAIRTEFAPEDMEEYFRWYYRLDPTHIGFFTKHTFEYITSKSNFTMVDDNDKNIIIISKNSSYTR